jgi:phosphate transport system protein
METIMPQHTTHAFDDDLRKLDVKISEMGDLGLKQITQATQALETHDVALAAAVITADDQVDVLQRQVEEHAVITIARRQPMGSDLREIVGSLRVANDLERIGDLAENIAKRVMLLKGEPHIDELMLQFQRMAHLVLDQLTQVLQSYERRDVGQALDVWRKDQEIDAMNSSLFREALTYMMEDARNITLCTHLLFCAKNLERIGDHITNIAETVYYIVEGSPLSEARPKADITSRESVTASS